MRALFPITLFLISAPLISRLAARSWPAAAEKLQHALRLADLYNWADAGPDFAEAETLFLAAGDQRNAFYARLGVIQIEQRAAHSARNIGAISQRSRINPILRTDKELHVLPHRERRHRRS